VYYVEDGADGLRARLDRSLAALDGGTLYADLGGAEAATNARAEQVLSGFVNGAARRASPAEMRQRIAAGELDGVDDPAAWGADAHALVDDDAGIVFPYDAGGTTATLVDALAARRGAVDRVDVGPTHDDREPAARERVERAAAVPDGARTAAESRALARAVDARDREWAAHVARAVETGWADPDETLVVAAADRGLDRYLAAGVDLPDHGVTVPGFDLVRPASLADRLADRVDGDPGAGEDHGPAHGETPGN
jgi:hypothetical protein